MPHRDPAERKAVTLAWKNRHRPRVEPQSEGLPPIGRIVFSADSSKVQCHACGRWFGSLNSHIRTHDMDFDAYRETYGIARTASLWPAALKDQQRQAALNRGQGDIGRLHIPPNKPRQAGIATRLSSRVNSSESRAGNAPRRKLP